MTNKKLIHYSRAYSAEEKRATIEFQYEDDSKKYIFIIPGDMIYVTDCDYAELSRRIEADIDDSEAYDLTDGCSYFLASDYADEICDALIWLVATYVK